MKNILTLDIEGWYQSSLDILGPEHAGRPRPVPPGERVVPNTRHLLRILEEHDARATCFVLGAVAETYPGLVREIHAAGHEIATHGYAHDLVYELTPEAFRADVEHAIEVTQSVIRHSSFVIRGYRAPYFSITRDSEWALDALAELGLDYDSSIFPIRRRLYGFPGRKAFPHTVQGKNGRALLELPISTFSVLGQNLPVGGGGYFRLLPYVVIRAAIRAINRRGQPAVFYLHPYELDTEALRRPLPGEDGSESLKTRRARWTQRLRRGTVEGKLRRLLVDFKWVPVREWMAEEQRCGGAGGRG